MATENSQIFLLLAIPVLGIFADHSESQELRCQCIQTQSDFISLKFIAKVQIIPAGPHCNRKEIIVTLKNEKLICLDPEAEWVMNIIKKIDIEPLTDDHTKSITIYGSQEPFVSS